MPSRETRPLNLIGLLAKVGSAAALLSIFTYSLGASVLAVGYIKAGLSLSRSLSLQDPTYVLVQGTLVLIASAVTGGLAALGMLAASAALTRRLKWSEHRKLELRSDYDKRDVNILLTHYEGLFQRRHFSAMAPTLFIATWLPAVTLAAGFSRSIVINVSILVFVPVIIFSIPWFVRRHVNHSRIANVRLLPLAITYAGTFFLGSVAAASIGPIQLDSAHVITSSGTIDGYFVGTNGDSVQITDGKKLVFLPLSKVNRLELIRRERPNIFENRHWMTIVVLTLLAIALSALVASLIRWNTKQERTLRKKIAKLEDRLFVPTEANVDR